MHFFFFFFDDVDVGGFLFGVLWGWKAIVCLFMLKQREAGSSVRIWKTQTKPFCLGHMLDFLSFSNFIFFFAFFESKKCLDKLKIVRVKVLWAEENLFSALVTRIWVKVFVFCFHYSYYCCCWLVFLLYYENCSNDNNVLFLLSLSLWKRMQDNGKKE